MMENNQTNTNTPANSYPWREEENNRPVRAAEVHGTNWMEAEQKVVKKSINKLLWGTVAGGVLGATAVILADRATREEVMRGTIKAKDKTVEMVSSAFSNPNEVIDQVEQASNRLSELASEASSNMKEATGSLYTGDTSSTSSTSASNESSNKTIY